MMGRSAEWAYANARLRANLGSLLGADYFEEISKLSLSEALKFIESHPPHGIQWPEIADEQSEDIGAILYKAYEEHFLHLSRLLAAPFRRVFILSLEHLVVDDLKHLIRRIVGGHQGEDRESAHFLTLERSSIIPDLSKVDDLDALSKRLRDSVFSSPYELARSTFEETKEVLAFEVALDLDYHRRLSMAIQELPAEDAKSVDAIFRRQCDIKNLQWILRYRFAFQLSEVEIFNYTLSYSYELNDELVMELARMQEPSESLGILEGLPMGDFLRARLATERESASLIQIEHMLDIYWEKLHREALRNGVFGLRPFICYQVLKELERSRLKRCIIGLQLDLPPHEIAQALQLYPGEGEVKRV